MSRAAELATKAARAEGASLIRHLWRQIKADVTGLPVRVPTSVETTATGAAILAAVGAGSTPAWPRRSPPSSTTSRTSTSPTPSATSSTAAPTIATRGVLRSEAGVREGGDLTQHGQPPDDGLHRRVQLPRAVPRRRPQLARRPAPLPHRRPAAAGHAGRGGRVRADHLAPRPGRLGRRGRRRGLLRRPA